MSLNKSSQFCTQCLSVCHIITLNFAPWPCLKGLSNKVMLREISGSHGGEYEDDSFMRYSAM
jgi:hypothetical protein